MANTTVEVDAVIEIVKALPLDAPDRRIVEHIEKGSHGWWFNSSRIIILETIANKYGNFDFLS